MPRRNRGPYLKFLPQRGAWYIHWAECGTTRQRSTGTSDSGAAQIALANFIHEQDRASRPAGPSDPGSFPIAEALALYGTEHAPTAADPQRIGYAIAALIPYWADRMVGDITRQTCRGYTTYRAKATGTVRRELATLRAAINYAKEEGRLTYTPTVHLPAKPEGKDRWLRRSEAAALLNAARTGHASTRTYLPLFILIALYTGARKGAILSLRWPQVDLIGERINFNEEGRTRTSKGRAHLPIPKRLLTFLRLARRRGTDLGYVIHRDGHQLDNMKRAFNTTCANAGLHDVTPHTLRHTCGTWMAQHGVPLEQIGAWLGHSDARTTKLYAHHHPDFMNQARNAADRRKA
ncbi:MAG: tyrosine-type recombinase/integrase [Sphingomonadaceae bacterium]